MSHSKILAEKCSQSKNPSHCTNRWNSPFFIRSSKIFLVLIYFWYIFLFLLFESFNWKFSVLLCHPCLFTIRFYIAAPKISGHSQMETFRVTFRFPFYVYRPDHEKRIHLNTLPYSFSKWLTWQRIPQIFNSFHANVIFLCPLKFQGV